MKSKLNLITIIFIAATFFLGLNGYAQRYSSNPLNMPKQTPFVNSKTPNDTLLPGNLPNVAFPDYVMLTAEKGGYILGTNYFKDKCKCQQFKVSSSYTIEGAIYWFGFKKIVDTGIIKFAIWKMDSVNGTTADTNNQPCPGTLVEAIADTMTYIDTADYPKQSHIVMFSIPVPVTSDYCIGFDMSEMKDDTIALVSTKKGQGGNLELVWEQWSTNNQWYTLQGAQWDSGTVDVDAMILPIIDNTSGCVENDEFISGMKLSGVYPNPGNDYCTLSYEFLTPPAAAYIEILDQSGKRVYYNDNIPAQQGVNKTIIDVSGYKNGLYFYILSSGESRMAKKMVISR